MNGYAAASGTATRDNIRVIRLSVSTNANASRHRNANNINASFADTRPAASGRERVRAT
jgi:hypothetical protein